ncbi:MAG: hypothetical protein AAFU34_15665 [Pseudomonadota bacterium]
MDEVAAICRQNDKAAYHWMGASKHRHAGDPPHLWQVRKLHEECTKRGLQVPLEWLVYGAAEAEVDALITPIAAE